MTSVSANWVNGHEVLSFVTIKSLDSGFDL